MQVRAWQDPPGHPGPPAPAAWLQHHLIRFLIHPHVGRRQAAAQELIVQGGACGWQHGGAMAVAQRESGHAGGFVIITRAARLGGPWTMPTLCVRLSTPTHLRRGLQSPAPAAGGGAAWQGALPQPLTPTFRLPPRCQPLPPVRLAGNTSDLPKGRRKLPAAAAVEHGAMQDSSPVGGDTPQTQTTARPATRAESVWHQS